MKPTPPFTRREFLNTGITLASTAATLPLFLRDSAAALAAQPGAIGAKPGAAEDHVLVVIQLSGGNDGLNTVVPYGFDEYYRVRPVLAVKRNEVLAVDERHGIGLHPQLGAVKRMLDDGLAAVVQGVGYPNPNRSHFASMDIWHTADPSGGRGLGWLGKALDQRAAEAGGVSEPTACICIGPEAPLAAQGRCAKPIAFENANLFQWSGKSLHPALGRSYDQINRVGGETASAQEDDLAFVMRTAADAQIASDRIRAAVRQAPQTDFPQGQLANQLRQVAAMIRAEMPTRVYYVGLGGFDTHAGQLPRQGNLLREFGSAVQGFYRELDAIGQRSRVLTMAFSEFGRRIAQNASNGTDHGTAAPLFLFGEMVRPGLLGDHPSLTETDHGDLIHNVDFRSVYATILDRWMKVNSRAVLGRAFAPARVLKG